MLNNKYIENLTGLKNLNVKLIEEFDGKHHIYGTMECRIHQCPRCGTHTSKVHDYRTQIIKHTPAFALPTVVHLRKRRHVCPMCGKRFFEKISFLPKYQRTTNALWGYAISELRISASMSSVAKRLDVSSTTVARMLDQLNYSCSKLPETLSIDEFRGNCGGEKYQSILTDPKNKKVLDILPNRKSEDLFKYFSQAKDRSQVKYVVMDLSTLFRSVVQSSFPNAEIVADKFHALRLSVNALENVRKEVQKSFANKRRKYFKRSKTLLIKHKDKLKPNELEQVSLMLQLSKTLAEAYYLKEKAYELFDSKDVTTAKKRMLEFKMSAQTANIPEFNKVSNTYTEWEKEIFNIFKTGLSNGYTEGCNNKIKVIKRNAYGMRNIERFRTRILHSFA